METLVLLVLVLVVAQVAAATGAVVYLLKILDELRKEKPLPAPVVVTPPVAEPAVAVAPEPAPEPTPEPVIHWKSKPVFEPASEWPQPVAVSPSHPVEPVRNNHLPQHVFELWANADSREPAFVISTHCTGAPDTITEAGRVFDKVEYVSERDVFLYQERNSA